MIILALFIFTVLAEVPVWAKVVANFDECKEFFYRGTEPQGMDQNARKICQKYEYGGNFYASLYSTYHRIPVYSAYKFNCSCKDQKNQVGPKSGPWFIEPQVRLYFFYFIQLSYQGEDTMQPETNNNRDRVKSNQAVNGDYCNTGYDRGHLNPNSFQCDDDRKATFTLTNSAPMDACFNRVPWKQWEQRVRDILKDNAVSGTAYLVTGTVPPSEDFRIPRQGQFDDPSFAGLATVQPLQWRPLPALGNSH
uniref:Uncharacterized protein n=1 Tax=Paramormyrops kingsleyae TaxID=1676925 RepID=A0A3B3R8V0_9TELE